MGNYRHRHRRPAGTTVRRLPRQKTAVQEASQGQGQQERHEGRNGRQRSSDIGRTDIKGEETHTHYQTSVRYLIFYNSKNLNQHL